jgi:uncharacterized membrane protein
MWPFHKRQVSYISEEEKEMIAEAIGKAEMQTSGEIRVYIEGKCRHKDALGRAKQKFTKLKMFATKERNGVLVYIALHDKKLAIYGDVGIHAKVGNDFWNDSVKKMVDIYSKDHNLTKGIINVVLEIGNALKLHFPYDSENDVNELPNEIIIHK